MKVIALQSGSNGNAYYVEHKRTRLLFDAGISGTKAHERLAAVGIDACDVDALIISHDHSDHVRCAGVYHRRFGMPLFMTGKTFEAVGLKCSLGHLDRVEHFEAGETLEIGDIAVHTIRTPHDCADGVAFVIEGGRKRLGILTDLGHVFADLPGVVSELDAVFIESNYDPEMLEDGGYPEFLKQRIRGRRGHLANTEAAQLVNEADSARLKWVCLAHLSQNNNHPDLALKAHRRVLGRKFPLLVASRHESTGVLDV